VAAGAAVASATLLAKGPQVLLRCCCHQHPQSSTSSTTHSSRNGSRYGDQWSDFRAARTSSFASTSQFQLLGKLHAYASWQQCFEMGPHKKKQSKVGALATARYDFMHYSICVRSYMRHFHAMSESGCRRNPCKSKLRTCNA
jgi:hypothetical protein